MAKIKLDKMELGELKQLQKDVRKAIVSFEQRKKKEARAALEEDARKLGFSLGQLTGDAKPRKTVGKPKFQNPDDSTQTWTGRGRKPDWFTKALDSGVAEDAMLID